MRPTRSAAIAVLVLSACANEARSPDGRFARGGASLFVEPSGASAMFFAGSVSPSAYDYDAMRASGALGCSKEHKSAMSLSGGARLVEAGVVEVETPRVPSLALEYDAGTGAHVASSDIPLFFTGDAVTVRGAGSRDVPSFEARAAAPEVIWLHEPAVGSTIDRGSDLVLKWDSADGYLDVVVKTTARSWACVFPAKRGTATIERHLLEDEPPGPITLQAAAVSAVAVDTAGWHVALAVASVRKERAVVLR